MDIRPLDSTDLPDVLDLTLVTFGSFYEDSYRPAVGEKVFHNRHGGWREDYRRHMAGLHDPERGAYAAVATSNSTIAGYVAWVLQPQQRHGEIDILAVAPSYRGQHCGRRLAEHVIEAMRTAGAEVVTIGTGGDAFHAPARALYTELGFTPFPNIIYTRAL